MNRSCSGRLAKSLAHENIGPIWVSGATAPLAQRYCNGVIRRREGPEGFSPDNEAPADVPDDILGTPPPLVDRDCSYQHLGSDVYTMGFAYKGETILGDGVWWWQYDSRTDSWRELFTDGYIPSPHG